MPIQWFPGHMARARRVLAENLKLVDVVVEIIDARLPFSSRNPEIDRIIGNKRRVLVCNKADLADPRLSDYWREYYKNNDIGVVFTDCHTGNGIKAVTAEIKRVMADKIQRYLEKGRKEPVIHAMVVGVPNVGKSSFINKVAGKAVAVTGDKPGVTRNKQWLKLNPDIYLLDTPGLLWPKIENQRSAYKLACSGAIKDDILDVEDLASFLIYYLSQNYPDAINERFKVDTEAVLEGVDRDDRVMCGVAMLDACGKKRGCIIRGGEIDYTRISNIILDEFRAGKIGRITLDNPEVLTEGPDGSQIAEEISREIDEIENEE